MLLARQERTLAIDGVYIHVRQFIVMFGFMQTKPYPPDHAVHQQGYESCV
jgi:hypothetical protein